MAKSAVITPQDYFDGLDPVSKRRYELKLQSVDGIDPYKNDVWSDDVGLLPPVAQADIYEYLVHRTSYYTMQSFKANKALGAGFNFLLNSLLCDYILIW
jgi:hypothetical protein